MTFQGYVTDHQSGDEWTALIGKFVANYGSLEFLSYEWRKALTGSVSATYCKKVFSKRIDSLVRDVERDPRCAPHRDAIVHCWEQTKVGLDARNRVCHQPIGYVWVGREADASPPDAIVFLTYEKGKSIRYEIPKAAFADQVNVLVKLAEDLARLQMEVFGEPVREGAQ